MNVCIATGTRADWGLLSPLAKELKSRSGIQLQILATNMHLLPQYGHTIDEIIADGFSIDATAPMPCADDSALERAKSMGACLNGSAEALAQLGPDMLVMLGDRFEMLAIASAALMMNVPIAHISGGEITEGAIDDSIRHAITKLASLHFTATEEYRRRVIQLGEMPERVINAGALGVWNAMRQPLLSQDELQHSLNFEFERGKLIIATFHSATLDTADPGIRVQEMLNALDDFPNHDVILTYPNNDFGSEKIISRIIKWSKDRPRTLIIKSMGMIRYLSALQFAAAVVGNSSSGIVEVPSTGVPTVDIGIRQKGRICGPSIIHCGDYKAEISAAIAQALSPRWQELAKRRENPYAKPNTVKIIADAITQAKPQELTTKKFYDL